MPYRNDDDLLRHQDILMDKLKHSDLMLIIEIIVTSAKSLSNFAIKSPALGGASEYFVER